MSKTKTLRRQRYRPVSEFDDVTLASKREYWRTKKREQRAKQSMTKKKVKAPNTGICKPVRTAGHVSHIPHAEFGPTLLNSDGSYQSSVAKNLTKQLMICKKQIKSLSTEESNMDAAMIKHNGAPLTKGLPVPAACIKLHSNSIATRQHRSSAFNGNLSGISQMSGVSQLAPKCSKQNTQIKRCVPPMSLAFMECKDQHILARRGTNTNRSACANVPVCSKALCKTTDVAMTEEEKAAKRRENWRIKKREQRAKRAEKLKMDRERVLFFEKGQQETGKRSCVAPTHPLSTVNTIALRGAKQHNSVMSADLRLSAGKPLHCGVRVERDKLSLHRQCPHKPQSVVLKVVDGQRLLAKNLSSVSVYSTNHLQDSKRNFMAISSGVSMQPSRSTQANEQSKMPQRRFVRIQRRQGNNRVESAEERLAKQREYWRIKKREQRAKRSLTLKARLKERDAFNWRAKRYQSILEQMRKTSTGLQKVAQPNKMTLPNTSKTISGFIKDDGTETVPISQTTAEKRPPAMTCSLSAVRSLYSSGPSMSQKLLRSRARPVLHSIPNNMNSSVNIQRPTGQNITDFDSLVGSKLVSGTEDANVLKSSTEDTQAEELTAENWTTCKRELKSCDSFSAVMPSLVLTPCDATKQEPISPSIATVCSLTEQSQTMDIKDIKSPPSPPPEARSEIEPSSISDSQATTLLVVASMKRLLEESLNSVGDNNSSSIGKDELLPCKAEDKTCLQEEKETDRKSDFTTNHDFSGDTYPSVGVKQSPSPCHSPLQTHDVSAEGTVLSCRDASLQLPSTATIDSSCFSQGTGDERCDLAMALRVNPLRRGNQAHSGKTTVPQQSCPPQARGGQRLNGNSELQKKREYWRLMKRQQRARKAKEERGKGALHPSQQLQRKCGTTQVPHPPVAQSGSHTDLNNRVILPTVTSRPTQLVLSPTASANQHPSNEARQLLLEGQQGKTKASEASQVNKWQLQVQGNGPTSSTRPSTVTFTQMNHVKLSDPQTQTSNQSHLKITANQEPYPEEIIRKKRMQWRIKKQEQRARKAARERGLNHQATLSHSRHNWSSNITDSVQSTPPERLDYLPGQCQTTSFKDEADMCYLPDDDCSDEPLSEDKWRSTYLMDYDPINQLLVCMVCGEQQYTFSAEGVSAHIEETHPGTLSLEEAERQRILEAWDEQVAVRERFFTNQLWQNSDALKDQSSRYMAEVEVVLDPDDKTDKYK